MDMDIEAELTKMDSVTNPKIDELEAACAKKTLPDDKINNEADEYCVRGDGNGVQLTTNAPDSDVATATPAAAMQNNSSVSVEMDGNDVTEEVDIDKRNQSPIQIDGKLDVDALSDKVVTVVVTTTTTKIAAPMIEKRRYSDSKWASDDEGFAGFDDSSVMPRRKKVKEEPLSDSELCANDGATLDIKVEVKSEHGTEKESEEESTNLAPVWPQEKREPMPSAANNVSLESCAVQTLIETEPKYRRPFELGWKRELVYRSQVDKTRPKSDKAEVYYITPYGKKLRTKVEIQGHLQEGLDVTMFSFTRVALGLGPDQETVRTAKPKHLAATKRPTNFLDLGEPDPMFGFGKRIPKPKMPKGASPPPQSPVHKSVNRSAHSNARKSIEPQLPPDVEPIKLAAAIPKATKTRTKGEPCTIQCVLAMGTIPQLQCRKCFCLFHHECVGMAKYDKPIANYICENCIYEMAILNTPPTTSEHTSNESKLPPIISSTQSVATTASVMVPRNVTYSQPAPVVAVAPTPSTRIDVNKESNSVIGGMTTWVPPTANVMSNRSQLDIETTPPQTIAIVAGRKYIMVPKTNLMSVSPSGEVRIGDNNGIPLPYVNDVELPNSTVNQNTPAGNATGALMTGEDVTPLYKKRIVSRSTSKTQTPSGSPSHTATTLLQTSPPKGTPVNSNNVSTSVHRLFANNFFNNVSLGYDLLLHTFQYLKVQELQRASCVCRMWNQIANHPSLWKTVRMKNSQVNDWIGFVNTLKRNGTKQLDLRKMLISGNGDTAWQHFSDNIGQVSELESIDLCRCPSWVVERLIESNPRLAIINAVAIKDDHLKLTTISDRNKLTEFRLKSLNVFSIDSLSPLRHLVDLRHLSLTSVKELGKKEIEVIGNLDALETLELGECSEFSNDFSIDVLSNLSNLERLRLEKGQDQCCLFDILDTIAKMPNLAQLELVNFDIKTGFDVHLPKCSNLKRLLIIPTYISQSATTNHMVLKGILELANSLEQLTWVVTLELLRVTELYVDQYNCKRKEAKLTEDKIPVLKPIPGFSEEEWRGRTAPQKTISDAPQVEIIPLGTIESFLSSKMPNTKCSILKVPYLATWRQNMTDMQ